MMKNPEVAATSNLPRSSKPQQNLSTASYDTKVTSSPFNSQEAMAQNDRELSRVEIGSKKDSSGTNWIVIVAVIAIIGGALYYLMSMI
jgi:hypothetical protein